MGGTPQPPLNQNQDGFTPVKLKDGTTIKLKGTGLTPQQVSAGVAKFRASQSAMPKSSAAQKPPIPPVPSGTPRPPSSSSNPLPEYQGSFGGFTPGHLYEAAKQGLKNVVVGTTGYSPLIKGPEGEQRGEGGVLDLLFNLDKHYPEMTEQSNEIHRQAREAFKRVGKSKDPLEASENAVEGFSKALFASIPAIGPWLNDKYNQAMSGDLGGAGTELATTAAAGKVLSNLQEKGVTTAEDLKNSFPKHVIVAAANDTLDSSAKDFKANMAQAVKNTNESIGNKVKLIASADRTASPNGSFLKSDISQTTQDAIDSVNAQHLDLPGTKIIQKALSRYGNTLTWEDVKDLRSAVDAARQGATGKDLAILGRLQKVYSEALEQRARQLGKLPEYQEYTDTTKSLREHQNGIVSKINDADTGLKTFNELAKQSNRPQLNDLFHILEKHGGMPSNYLDNLLEDHSKIGRLAALAEGTTYTGERGGRLGSIMRHPLVAGTAMAATGAATSGTPLGLRFILSLGAAMKADDIMNRYEAAKQIRELGGPDGVTGRYGQAPLGNQTPFGPSGPTGPQQPAGPGLPPAGGPTGGVPNPPPTRPPVPPAGPSPSPSPVGLLSPALQKLVRPSEEVMVQPPSTSRGTPTGEARIFEGKSGTLPPELHADLEKQAGRKLTNDEAVALDRANLERQMGQGKPDESSAIREEHRSKLEAKGRPEEFTHVTTETLPSGVKVHTQTGVSELHDLEQKLIDSGRIKREDIPRLRRAALEKAPQYKGQEYYEAILRRYLTKVPEEARGREPSARTGMTKDTAEARKAKARERVAKAREEAGRTQQKSSLEDQARQLAGKVTPQSLKNVPLVEVEEAAKEFDHTPNQMIWRGLQKLKRSQGWTEDVYRGYLEDFILKSIDMKAKNP